MIQGFSIFLGLFQVMTRQTPNQDLMHVLFGNNSVWEFLGVNNEWIVGISSMIGWWFSLVVSLVSYFKHAPTRYMFHPFSYRIPRSFGGFPRQKKPTNHLDPQRIWCRQDSGGILIEGLRIYWLFLRTTMLPHCPSVLWFPISKIDSPYYNLNYLPFGL